jgi:hypothetical protein
MYGACTKSARAAAWRGAAILGVTCALAVATTGEPQQPPASVDEQVAPVIFARPATPGAAVPGMTRKNGNVNASAQMPPMIFGHTTAPGGIAGVLQNCAQPDANCQLPDQAGHGEDGIIGATSDAQAGFGVADNFVFDAGGTVSSICWWGFYLDFNAGEDCGSEVATDHFTITLYFNQPACPSGVPGIQIPAAMYVQDNGDLVNFTKVATGNMVGGNAEYEYTCEIAGPALSAGRCTWIEIQNDTAETLGDCLWLWETAPNADEGGNGDAWSYQFGTTPPTNDFDLALCLNEPLGDQIVCSAASEPNPGCAGSTNNCWEGNTGAPQPGCNEVCCCTLVCDPDEGGLPLCCITDWTQQCADIALDLGCTTLPPLPLCADGGPGDPGQDPANCQVYNDVNAYNSTTSPGVEEDLFRAADDFQTVNNETITEVCWQGTYGTAPIADNFRIRIMGDAGGYPDEGNVIADESQGDFTAFSRVDTNVEGADGLYIIYQYRATLATPTDVTGGECYWLEITNGLNPDESWFWELSDDGNDRVMLDGFGDDTIPPDGYDALDAIGGIDFGFCLGVPLAAPACGFQTLYETGNHEVVNFDDADGGNYTATNLGWTSGDLAVAGDHQRRCAQAFTLPPLPPGANAWSIEQLFLEGFYPDDAPTNEAMNFEIFTRTSLDQDIAEADSVALLEVPISANDPTDPDYPNEFGIVASGFFMEPGDYWLTFWASNSSGTPQTTASNIAWFTNAPDGINNACTGTMPVPATGFQGCTPTDPTGFPPGTPAMLRARVWPPAAPEPDPSGFGAYSLPITTLTVDPVNDPTPDPADLYNAAFRMRGTAVAVAPPCPWDCQTEPNGQVDISDFLALLAQFGQVGTSCDFDGGGVGVTDFLAFLANFGPCPTP